MDKERYIFIVYMISLLLTLFIAALDIVIVVTLYETIGIKFNDFGNVSWLVTGYDLSNAIFMLSWGRVASLIGVKESLLISIIIFEVGSLISALSNSLGVLIGERVIAGFGGSGIESLVFVAGTSYVEEKYRGLTTSLLALSYVIAEGSGPFIGGLLTEKVSWRWCFYINLPIGAAAFVILLLCSDSFQLASRGRCQTFWRVVRKYNYGKLLKSTYWKQIGITIVCELDILGILLSSSGFTLLMLGLSFG
ncbi:hypothetical protein BZL39_B10150 [Zygosaccharomyces parabailii]|nr:hypothetical protein BZL39_B10150 [Zygosaccharomyces parabailii]CAI4538073.1 BDM_1a_G0025950.mRNA.1.CDS.1 [Saccharomyces cerevisiae]CAI7167711.1 BDM_1a_G0025950.mRNA.1.CDS.1 [Saccharomyces cerevisiae]